MAVINFLNVKEGDCTVIEHNFGHVTVIDVCNAKPTNHTLESSTQIQASKELGTNGNFRQKDYPVNPISYLKAKGIKDIFRYIQTHPDMDHMDGIRHLFSEFEITNIWDTENVKEMNSWEGSPYDEDDWFFYKNIRDSKPSEAPKRITLYSNAKGKYYNRAEDDSPGGDGLFVLAPTKELIRQANDAEDEFNDSSYVILYRTGNNKKIVFAGDSHDKTWEHILAEHKSDVSNIDLLIAPHHGRDSDRSYDFLDVLNPKLTFFGNARSEHLAYDQWSRRNLTLITNNEANCMIVDTSGTEMTLYVTHQHFAKSFNPSTYFSDKFKGWYIGEIT